MQRSLRSIVYKIKKTTLILLVSAAHPGSYHETFNTLHDMGSCRILSIITPQVPVPKAFNLNVRLWLEEWTPPSGLSHFLTRSLIGNRKITSIATISTLLFSFFPGAVSLLFVLFLRIMEFIQAIYSSYKCYKWSCAMLIYHTNNVWFSLIPNPLYLYK